MERLDAFEAMLPDIRRQADYEKEQMERLKTEGKKTATYRLYFGNRMLYKMMLEKNKEEMNPLPFPSAIMLICVFTVSAKGLWERILFCPASCPLRESCATRQRTREAGKGKYRFIV